MTANGSGCLWFGPSTDDPAMAWIYDITVDEDKRRRGWGRAIMRAFESEAQRARLRARASTSTATTTSHVVSTNRSGTLRHARQLHKELPGG